MINAYELKQAMRRDRLEKRAVRLKSESSQRFANADRMADMMNGQPILIGHHSEKRHRRDIRRMENNMRKGCELAKEADDTARRAAAVGSAGISSDDPEAVRKIKQELFDLESKQTEMREANKFVRKNDVPGLQQLLGWPERACAKLLEPDFMGRKGFAGYELTNNSANIRRLKERLEQLQKRADAADTVEEIGNVTVEVTPSENRVRVRFPGKPSKDVIQRCRSYGFRWSPTEGAWQRFYSSSAAYWVKELANLANSNKEKCGGPATDCNPPGSMAVALNLGRKKCDDSAA